MNIAIGITTTPSRSDVFYECLRQWQKYLPDNAAIHIHVDDGFRGVSYSKNETLKMCEYAYHIFIVDDDIFPTEENWHVPYIESGLNHACWNYNRKQIKFTISASSEQPFTEVRLTEFAEYEKPNGCMLYATRKVIETVGGWDTDFKGYGYEHVNWSDRIFNAGLTPARYIDIPNSKGLFEMADCESSFTSSDRALIPANYVLYQEKYYSKEFKPFK